MGKKTLIAAVTLSATVLMAGCGGGGGSDTGKEPDLSKFPLYNENYAALEYGADDYAKNLSAPYWLGNVIYNEIALPVLYDNGECYAKLLYAPEKVISVRDRTLTVAYEEGKDYTVDKANKRIIVPQTSSIATWRDGIDEGRNVPEEFNRVDSWTAMDWVDDYVIWDPAGKGQSVYAESPVFYGKYLSITYAYDVADLPENIYHSFDKWKLTGIRNKLQSGQNITLAVLGDSITEGCSSSEKLSAVLGQTVLPDSPCYARQLKNEIERVYGVEVNFVNAGVGGSNSGDLFNATSAVGPKTMQLYAQAKQAVPDLCVIAYGTNDVGVNDEFEFAENIERAITEMRAVSADCQFILVNAFPCNPLVEQKSGMYQKFLAKMNAIAAEYDDGSVAVVDLHKVGEYMLQTKRYCELSSSNVNHPNDFMHRTYAMSIMSALCDYKK